MTKLHYIQGSRLAAINTSKRGVGSTVNQHRCDTLDDSVALQPCPLRSPLLRQITYRNDPLCKKHNPVEASSGNRLATPGNMTMPSRSAGRGGEGVMLGADVW